MTASDDPRIATLIVPIELRALAVGQDQPSVAAMAPNFAIDEDEALPWLGQNAEQRPFAQATLAMGVHLHWQLPATLRRSQLGYGVDAQAIEPFMKASALRHHASTAIDAILAATAPSRQRLAQTIAELLLGAGLPTAQARQVAEHLAELATGVNRFPVVPNRWRISRWLGEVGTGMPTQWIVESDRLWRHGDSADSLDTVDPCQAQNLLSPSVLHLPNERSALKAADPLSRRLGRAFPAEGWVESLVSGERFAPLTALGFGHPMFAAALPHCYNVFGFHDPLAELQAEGADPSARVSYTVVGWYSDPAQNALDDASALAANYGWTSTGEAAPARLLLRGELAGVDWQRAATPQPRARPAAVAIGHTTAEALSAAVASQDAHQGTDGLESYLNVLQLGLVDRLHDRHPGGLKAWDLALHRHDFTAVPGGPRWVLRPQDKAAGAAAKPLPRAFAALLEHLNRSQALLSAAERRLQAEREQLFADWTQHLALNHARQLSVAEAEVFDGQRNAARARLVAGLAVVKAAATRAAAALRQTQAARQALQQDLDGWEHGAGHRLQTTPGPRFWQPSDPVLLIWGDDVQAPPRFDAACSLVACSVAEAAAASGQPRADDAAPWQALLMAWELAYEAEATLPDGGGYRPRYLADGFPLDPADSNDLSAPPPRAAGAAKLIAGLAPLSQAPTTPLAAQVQRFLDSYPAGADAGADADALALEAGLQQMLAKLQAAPLQSQALGGLNDALLGRRHALEFPVLDPHAGSAEEFRFGLDIGKAVAQGNGRGCVPEGMFSPLRAGWLSLHRLTLIDAFGRLLPIVDQGLKEDGSESGAPLRPAQLIRSQRLAGAADTPGRCSLRPRFVPPVRLDFRWRSAADHAVDADHEPANHPVVGWLLLDRVDRCLDVYGPEGTALGSLNLDGALWQGAPGPGFALRPERALPTGPLRELVSGLMAAIEASGTRDYLDQLLNAIDDMTQTILPKQHDQQGGLALLIGRPLAIVRATLGLSLAAPAPLDPRIEAFTAPLDRPRNSAGLAELLVPVRLGHRAHLDDGLVGYFVGPSNQASTYQTFFVEQFEGAETVGVRHPAADQVAVSAAGAPVPVTLLIDPRAPVHATTGIVPTKAIDLPAAMYSQALSSLAVSFPVGPLIGPRDLASGLPLPLPEEPGHTWQFVQAGTAGWRTLPVLPLQPAPVAALTLTQTQDIHEGWLLLTPERNDGAPDAS